VRGKFAPLDDEQRAELLAPADEHDLPWARFTEQGTVTYDRALHAFTFRCIVPATEEEADTVVISTAERLAAESVHALGADSRDLRSSSTDLDSIKIKGRRS
jgi:phage baseplate assembly protein gpV